MLDRFLKTSRTFTIAFALGAAVAAYGLHGYFQTPLDHALSLADRGLCAARDADHQRYWYACVDAAVAMELQARTMEHDAQLAEDTKAILADMKKGKKR